MRRRKVSRSKKRIADCSVPFWPALARLPKRISSNICAPFPKAKPLSSRGPKTFPVLRILMAYLLDTCVISELRKPRGDPGVSAWMANIHPDEAHLSVLTLGEIRRGIELHRPKDPRASGALERWLLGLESHYPDRLLPITATIADRWGRLSLGQPLPVSDGLFAATALEHKLTVITRNVADFKRSGVNLINPFLE